MQNQSETQSGSGGPLNHPRREEWMAYLYDELPRAEKAMLAAHLRDCAVCRAEVKPWQNAMGALDSGKAIPRRERIPVAQPLLKWGIAAALMLLAGFGAGRLVSPAGADTKALRAEIKAELRTELLAELEHRQEQQWVMYKYGDEEKRALDNKAIFAAIGKVDADRLADYDSLHKELETVAVLTQDSLQQQQQQIVTLAGSPVTSGGVLNQ